MVRAWYMDDSDIDQRQEHHREPPQFISLEDLYKTTGVEYFKVDHKNLKNDKTLSDLKSSRGYTYEDEITCSKECLQNYEDKEFIKAKRYFVGEPVWLPYNRPADNMECRLEYLEHLNKGFTLIK